jgi:undecaprenyl diphosphate synthase
MNKADTAMRSDTKPDAGRLPEHVAVIMDGNGRWARRRALPRVAGHRKGAESVRRLISACVRKQIPYLTLFAFSSENWARPPSEVQRLMELFLDALNKDVKELHENGVCFRVIGERGALDPEIVTRIERGEELTRNNTKLILSVAINYGGRADIVEACRRIAAAVAEGKMSLDAIDAGTIAAHLQTAGLPEPDLFIRSGGEQRISNFLLWQLAYTELFFTDVLWPDFDEAEFDRALDFFAGRQRRFGRTGEQVGAG